MVTEEDTALLHNVRDITGVKVFVAAVVCSIFFLDSFAKLKCVIT